MTGYREWNESLRVVASTSTVSETSERPNVCQGATERSQSNRRQRLLLLHYGFLLLGIRQSVHCHFGVDKFKNYCGEPYSSSMVIELLIPPSVWSEEKVVGM